MHGEPRQSCIYVIGSLRNERVPVVGNALRAAGYEAFDEWYSVGPEADDYWQRYAKNRGQSYREALDSYIARNTFQLDYDHLKRCDAAVLVYPAGRSAHLELGFVCGSGKPGFILLDGEPGPDDRWDVMYQFARESGGDIFYSLEGMLQCLPAYVPPVDGEDVPF